MSVGGQILSIIHSYFGASTKGDARKRLIKKYAKKWRAKKGTIKKASI